MSVRGDDYDLGYKAAQLDAVDLYGGPLRESESTSNALADAAEAFKEAVFAHLHDVGSDGSAIFAEGRALEKEIERVRFGRVRGFGTPQRQRQGHAPGTAADYREEQ